MIRYEVSKIKRVRDYRILWEILNHQHSIKEIGYEIHGEEGKVSFTIPKVHALEMNNKLEKSGLVFRILEQ